MGDLGYLIGIIFISWFLVSAIIHIENNHDKIPFTNQENIQNDKTE